MSRIRIKDLMAETGLSRATLDRALNGRNGVHPRTQELIDNAIKKLSTEQSNTHSHVFPKITTKVDLLTRLDEGLTKQVYNFLSDSGSDVNFYDMTQKSSDDVLTIATKLCQDLESTLIICAKNEASLCDVLINARKQGKTIVTLTSDLEEEARDCYVGIDNRKAGETAAFLVNHSLQSLDSYKVAVVVGDYSFRCHEDREIGFRSMLRTYNPTISYTDIIKGEDSSEETYRSTLNILKQNKDVKAIYNVAGGNDGLIRALTELNLINEVTVVTHEVNNITTPLLREGKITFTLGQNTKELIKHALDAAQGSANERINYLDFSIYTPQNVPKS